MLLSKVLEFSTFDLGLVDYQSSSQFQKELFLSVKEGLFRSALIFCRHYPVITLGRLADKKNILLSQEKLSMRGISVCQSERGGDVTYHGPGQLVVYPVFNLNYLKKDIHLFLRNLEEVVINLLADLGIYAERRPGLTGVWLDNQKIASVGIAIKNWITFHGLSLNVKKEDLSNFSIIRPCGMDIKMTSIETILNRNIEFEGVKEILIDKFSNIFYN